MFEMSPTVTKRFVAVVIACVCSAYIEFLPCYLTVVQRLASYLRLCRRLYDHHTARHDAYRFTCSASNNESRFAIE